MDPTTSTTRGRPRGGRRTRAVAAVTALLTAALGVWASAAPAQAAGSGTGQQLAIPAYIYPSGTGLTDWQDIAAGGSNVGFAIANVANGPSGAVDANWTTALSDAHSAGVKVLGYVDTGYFGTADGRLTRLGGASISDWLDQAESDVNQWYKLYGSSIGGIFFDDALNTCGTNNQYANLYAELSQYVKATHPGAFTVINPGIDVPSCYANSADVILRFEGSYSSYQSFTPESWESGYDPRKFMDIVYSTPSANLSTAVSLSKTDGAGYVFFTDAGLPNPYDVLPSYWSSELTDLPASSTGTPSTPATPTASGITGTGATLSWTSSSSVAGYDVYENGTYLGESTYTSGTSTYAVTGLKPSTTYSFTVKARDLAGDVSAASSAKSVTTSAAASSAPTVPTGLAANTTLANSTGLSWTASTSSDSTVAYYDVYEGGSLILTVPAADTSVQFDGLSPNTAYSFTVAAVDATGGTSSQTGAVSVTTLNPASAISSPSSTLTSSNATYSATFNYEYSFNDVCIDSDASSATGYQVTSSDGTVVGCDYLIESDVLYKYAGTGTDWTWASTGDTPTQSVSIAGGGFLYSWQITSSWLGSFASTEHVVFLGSGFSPTNNPAYSALVTVTEGASAVVAGASSFTASSASFSGVFNGTYTDDLVCLDTDDSTTTGYQESGGTATIGCDYLIDNDTLYKYAGTGTDWTWTALTGDSPNETVNGSTVSWGIETSWLTSPASTWRLVYSGSTSGAAAFSNTLTITES
ncbi:fibronectin type III domain-containing protein [Actinospica durhamensis]|uniref:Fibronectin type III domain-containing protein n=1 Tax=Actinospica durhamensis TaxID=1508375 RepID=A0A941EN17_9ACTN|nr:spherulation-specific family 4 protein [Actinospica durhamensis]MBR7835430.1 fibronectin type III domain-containing protein [Actinospica durhamensis]